MKLHRPGGKPLIISFFDMMVLGMARRPLRALCQVAGAGQAVSAALTLRRVAISTKISKGLGPQLRRRFAPATGILIAKGANLIAIEAKHK